MVAREIVRIVALVVAIVLSAAIVVAGMLALGVVLDIAVDFAKAALAWMVAHDRAAGAIVAVAIVLAIVRKGLADEKVRIWHSGSKRRALLE